jgi:hypothetical protein
MEAATWPKTIGLASEQKREGIWYSDKIRVLA